mmetsp:Transcript_152640/g.489512  ORF Transcript_152640/g.489512 Transcript_152640/m.489512 type:complete len:272 (+) Transcript_152640:422-1237(+)
MRRAKPRSHPAAPRCPARLTQPRPRRGRRRCLLPPARLRRQHSRAVHGSHAALHRSRSNRRPQSRRPSLRMPSDARRPRAPPRRPGRAGGTPGTSPPPNRRSPSAQRTPATPRTTAVRPGPCRRAERPRATSPFGSAAERAEPRGRFRRWSQRRGRAGPARGPPSMGPSTLSVALVDPPAPAPEAAAAAAAALQGAWPLAVAPWVEQHPARRLRSVSGRRRCSSNRSPTCPPQGARRVPRSRRRGRRRGGLPRRRGRRTRGATPPRRPRSP